MAQQITDVAYHLQERLGLHLLMLDRMSDDGKAPVGKWKTYQNQNTKIYGENHNLGIHYRKSKVVAIDNDDPPHVDPFLPLLPPGAPFGRASKPVSQVLYRYEDDENEYRTRKLGGVVEFRAGVSYSLVYGLHRTSGETVGAELAQCESIPGAGAGDILHVARVIATGALMLKHWPAKEQHTRHDTSRSCAGYMRKAGISEEHATRVLEIIADRTGGDVPQRRRNVESTYRLEEGAYEYRKHVPDEMLTALDNIWRSVAYANTLEKLNSEWAYIADGRNVVVRLADGREFPEKAFVTYTSNQTIYDMQRRREVSAGSAWLKWSGRNDKSEVGSWPPPQKVPSGALNMWEKQTFAINHEAGDWSRYYELMLAICGDMLPQDHGSEPLRREAEEKYPPTSASQNREWLLKALAWKVQNPGAPLGVVIALWSPEKGTGKNTFVENYLELWHRRYRTVYTSQQHFSSRFNSDMRESLVMFINEALWPGNPAMASMAKAMVTDRELSVEQKYRDKEDVRNALAIFVASNDLYLWPVEEGDRRVVAFRVHPRHMVRDGRNGLVPDTNFFRGLWGQMENGGRAALLHCLKNLPLPADWRPGDDRPRTALWAHMAEEHRRREAERLGGRDG